MQGSGLLSNHIKTVSQLCCGKAYPILYIYTYENFQIHIYIYNTFLVYMRVQPKNFTLTVPHPPCIGIITCFNCLAGKWKLFSIKMVMDSCLLILSSCLYNITDPLFNRSYLVLKNRIMLHDHLVGILSRFKYDYWVSQSEKF